MVLRCMSKCKYLLINRLHDNKIAIMVNIDGKYVGRLTKQSYVLIYKYVGFNEKDQLDTGFNSEREAIAIIKQKKNIKKIRDRQYEDI